VFEDQYAMGDTSGRRHQRACRKSDLASHRLARCTRCAGDHREW
jgi:hypothetical protein